MCAALKNIKASRLAKLLGLPLQLLPNRQRKCPVCTSPARSAGAQPYLAALDGNENRSSNFERKAQLRCGGAMDIMPATFKVSDGAARYARAFGKVCLCPVQETACSAAQLRCQNRCPACLTHRLESPILVDISHIEQQSPDC